MAITTCGAIYRPSPMRSETAVCTLPHGHSTFHRTETAGERATREADFARAATLLCDGRESDAKRVWDGGAA